MCDPYILSCVTVFLHHFDQNFSQNPTTFYSLLVIDKIKPEVRAEGRTWPHALTRPACIRRFMHRPPVLERDVPETVIVWRCVCVCVCVCVWGGGGVAEVGMARPSDLETLIYVA